MNGIVLRYDTAVIFAFTAIIHCLTSFDSTHRPSQRGAIIRTKISNFLYSVFAKRLFFVEKIKNLTFVKHFTMRSLAHFVSKKDRIFLPKLLTSPLFRLYICTVNRRQSTQGFQQPLTFCSKLYQHPNWLTVRNIPTVIDSHEQSINTFYNNY